MSIVHELSPDAARAEERLRRLISLSIATLVCGALGYVALTGQFSVITDAFDGPAPVVGEVEQPEPKTPPPPQPRRENPPPNQTAPTNSDAPQVAVPFDIVDATEPAPPAPAGIITNPTFLERPSGRDFERYFPERALQRGVSGRAVLDCLVAASGRIDCRVASEDPPGWGFGEASLRAAQHFRVAPATSDGAPTSGGRLRVPMTWRAS